MQFILGTVPFHLADPDAAGNAANRFKEGTCWRIEQPDFDTKSETEYMSTSVKKAVLLTTPTKISAIAITDVGTLNVGLTLKEMLERLEMMVGPQVLLGNGVSGQGRRQGQDNDVAQAGHVRPLWRTRPGWRQSAFSRSIGVSLISRTGKTRSSHRTAINCIRLVAFEIGLEE